MAASMAERVRQAVSSWRHTDSMQVSADPGDVESVTVRYLMYVLLPACIWEVRSAVDGGRDVRRERLPSGYLTGVLAMVTSLIAVPYAEELWRCARARKR